MKLIIFTWLARTFVALLVIYFFLINEWSMGIFVFGFLFVTSFPFILIKKEKIYQILGLLYSLLLVIHALGIFWFYHLPYFASITHFIWGLMLGITIFLFLEKQKRFQLTYSKIAVATIIIVLLLGIFWEFTEFIWDTFFERYSSYSIAQLGIIDTISDLLLDTLGALVSVILKLKLSK